MNCSNLEHCNYRICPNYSYRLRGKLGKNRHSRPAAIKDYPAIENLIPLTLILSVLGLGLAWCWEGLGGAINIGFYLASVAVHFWIIYPRPYPYLIAIALPHPWDIVPGVLVDI